MWSLSFTRWTLFCASLRDEHILLRTAHWDVITQLNPQIRYARDKPESR